MEKRGDRAGGEQRHRHDQRHRGVAEQERERQEGAGQHGADQHPCHALAAHQMADGHADRQPADHDGDRLRADRVGQVHHAGQEERQRDVGRQPFLEGAQQDGGHRGARQAQQQPGDPVEEPPADRLLGGGPGHGGAFQVTAQARQVLVVLLQQDAQHPAPGHQAVEPAVRADQDQAALAVPDGPPGGDLLVDVRGDGGRVAVHQVGQRYVVIGGEQALDRQHAVHAPVGSADDDVGGAVEAPARHP
nr:hypothetical protein [Thermoactinospora rubra]